MKKSFTPVSADEVENVTSHEMPDGALYTGHMKKVTEGGEIILVKHGRGVQQWPDGAKYEGDWRDGMAQGRGTFHHANKDLYTGEFFKDRANGYGAYIHENG
jgi:hypothetical protein